VSRVVVLSGFALLIAAGCGSEEPVFACAGDGDCAAGYACITGSCVLTAARGDGGDRPTGDGGGARDGGDPTDDSGTDADGGAADGGGAGLDGGSADAGLDGGVADGGAGDAGLDAGTDGGGGDAGTADAGFDGGGVDAGAGDAGFDAGLDLRSCATVQASGVTSSGVFTLDPDGAGGNAPFAAYCEMDVAGGGWTLALKDDGRDGSFGYEDALWTNETGVNVGSQDTTMVEAKLPAFWSAPLKEILVVFSEADPTGAPDLFSTTTTTLRLPAVGSSLRWVFASDVFLPSGLGRDAWLGAMPSAGMQDRCNLEGLNVRPSSSGFYARARIGLVGNVENACDSPNSRIAVGGGGDGCNMDGSISTGNAVGCNGAGVEQNLPAFSAVFVRDATPDAPPPRATCEAWRDDGFSTTGAYFIDPDPDDDVPPVQTWCDMDVDGGGWTLVGRSEATGGLPFGWRSQIGSALVDDAPFSLGASVFSLPFDEVLFGARGAGKTWGANVYKWTGLPGDFVSAYGSDVFDAVVPTTVLGACSPSSGWNMFKWIGRTSRTDRFWARDFGGDEPYGLSDVGFAAFYDDCPQGGELNGDDGMILVR
jgi:hypothetical protein